MAAAPAGAPLTIASTSTRRVRPIRACSGVQYGTFSGSGGPLSGAASGNRHATRAVSTTVSAASNAISLLPAPSGVPFAMTSIR
jgi:hypothetical protein